MDKEDFRMLLLRASQSPHGLAIRTSDPRRLRALFYPIRKLEGLFELSFRVVETPTHNVQIERSGPAGGPTSNGHAPDDEDEGENSL